MKRLCDGVVGRIGGRTAKTDASSSVKPKPLLMLMIVVGYAFIIKSISLRKEGFFPSFSLFSFPSTDIPREKDRGKKKEKEVLMRQSRHPHCLSSLILLRPHFWKRALRSATFNFAFFFSLFSKLMERFCLKYLISFRLYFCFSFDQISICCCHCVCVFQVSWVRQSDLAILASGGVSHTSDNRITASADETLTDWELQIAEAQTKDSVSISLFFFLVLATVFL